MTGDAYDLDHVLGDSWMVGFLKSPPRNGAFSRKLGLGKEQLPVLLSSPEDWSRLVGNHEPATIPLFEHVRNEGIEADSIAVLA